MLYVEKIRRLLKTINFDMQQTAFAIHFAASEQKRRTMEAHYERLVRERDELEAKLELTTEASL